MTKKKPKERVWKKVLKKSFLTGQFLINCSEQALAPEGAGDPQVNKPVHQALKPSSFQFIAFVDKVGIAIKHQVYMFLLLIHNKTWMTTLPSWPAHQHLQALFF